MNSQVAPVSPDDTPFSETIAAATARRLEPGHAIDLVRNGAIFDVMEEELARARVHIHIIFYIWKPGRASDRVLAVLAERRRAGVPVRIVVDRLGCRGGFTDAVLPKLKAMGCEVKLFHVPGKVGIAKSASRNHRKIVLVDGRVGLAGGWCLWDKFLGDGRAKEEWRDVNVRVRGPCVRFMQQAFLENWRECGGALPPPDELPWPEQSAGGVPCTFVHSSGGELDMPKARALVRALLPSARRRLWISCAYFAPDDEQVALLRARARAGVDVRVLVPGPIHDVPAVREAGRAVYPRLLEAGVRIWEYQPSMLHSKSMVVDEGLCVVGSINLEPMSLNVLEEASVLFWSPAHADRLAADFEEDARWSKEITRETIPAPALNPIRGALRNAGAAFASMVRRWRRGDRLEQIGA
jgi:cardiolipin synthase